MLCGWFSQLRQKVIPSIRVYESRHPFNLLWLISIDEVLDSPTDIVSSERDNCLYVSDDTWIYKVDLHICQLVRWQSGLNFRDSLMSISSEGGLIKLSRVNSSFQVEVYRQDALRLKHLQLPSDILKASQAIQTPQGQFVIICEFTQAEICRRHKGLQGFYSEPIRLARRHTFSIDRENKSVGGLCLVDNYGHEIKRLTYDVHHDGLHPEHLPECIRYTDYTYPDDAPLYVRNNNIHNFPSRLFIDSRRSLLHVFTLHLYDKDKLALLDINSLIWKQALLTMDTHCHKQMMLVKVWYEDASKLLILGCGATVCVYTVGEQ